MSASPAAVQNGPRIFDISLPGLGAEQLTAWMRGNGIRSIGPRDPKLAADITWGALNNVPPCPNRPGVRFYTGLEHARNPGQAPAFGWRYFPYLAQVFRQAIFLMITPTDQDQWITTRLTEQEGRFARLEALTRQVPLADLPDLWRADLAAHLTSAREFFAGQPRYVELRHDQLSLQNLSKAFAPWYRVDRPRSAPPRRPDPDARLDAALPLPAPPTTTRQPIGKDADFVNRMAEFCLGKFTPEAAGIKSASGLYAHFNGDQVLRRNGTSWPICRNPELPGQPFIHQPGLPKIDRITGVLNECISLGRVGPLHLDMQDARRLGLVPDTVPGVPLVTYNRREGAQNLTLWPLPGYHTPGLPNFVHPAPPDPVAWQDKIDAVVWRGDLSGNMRDDKGGFGPSAHDILVQIDQLVPDDDPGLARIEAQLDRVPRMAALRRLTGPDFDLRLTLSRYMREFEALPMIHPHLDRRRPRSWFYRFRYILSLPGYDTGSNFLMAANSGSVVMKAEDGWELFYSHLFHSWEHYIPLATDASDAVEKLDWARRNPEKCRAMVRAANAVCAQLADMRLRHAALHRVLDGVGARMQGSKI